MLNARLYRAALVPFLFALAVAAFSLGGRPLPLASTLAPDAFEGARAFAGPQAPRRRPSPSGGRAAPATSAGAARSRDRSRPRRHRRGRLLGARAERVEGQTIDGERTLTQRDRRSGPGSTNATPIVIVAHRDAAARGSRAELSGTAALLELARVFAARETKRTIMLVSTSGGSGGDAGAARAARPSCTARSTRRSCSATSPRAHVRRPLVVPFSDGFGLGAAGARSAPSPTRSRTRRGSDPGAPSALGQLAHLALPAGRRASRACSTRRACPRCSSRPPANGAPRRGERVSAERLEGLGRARAERRRRPRHRARRLRGDADRPGPAAQDAARVGACGCSSARCCWPADRRRRRARARCAAGACRWAAGRCGRSAARCRSSAARCSLPARRLGVLGAAPGGAGAAERAAVRRDRRDRARGRRC